MDINLHPIFVHFPIALFISALGLEVVSLILAKEILHRTAFHIYILAICLAPFTVLTGLLEANELHLNHPILTIHRTFAFCTLGISLMSLPILEFAKSQGPKTFRIFFLIFLLLVVSSVVITAYNGGRMVYEYGVGVEH